MSSKATTASTSSTLMPDIRQAPLRRWPAAVPVIPPGMTGRTTPRKKVNTMTDAIGKTGVKTLGIRLPDELHAQFVLVAGLDGLSLGDAVKKAVELYVEAKRSEGDFAERAAAVLEDIEREAAARRAAIQGLFGQGAQAAEAPAIDKPTRRGRAAEQS